MEPDAEASRTGIAIRVKLEDTQAKMDWLMRHGTFALDILDEFGMEQRMAYLEQYRDLFAGLGNDLKRMMTVLSSPVRGAPASGTVERTLSSLQVLDNAFYRSQLKELTDRPTNEVPKKGEPVEPNLELEEMQPMSPKSREFWDSYIDETGGGYFRDKVEIPAPPKRSVPADAFFPGAPRRPRISGPDDSAAVQPEDSFLPRISCDCSFIPSPPHRSLLDAPLPKKVVSHPDPHKLNEPQSKIVNTPSSFAATMARSVPPISPDDSPNMSSMATDASTGQSAGLRAFSEPPRDLRDSSPSIRAQDRAVGAVRRRSARLHSDEFPPPKDRVQKIRESQRLKDRK